MFWIIAADCTIYYVNVLEYHTVFRDIHELDGNLSLILFVLPEYNLTETSLSKFFYDLVVVEDSTKIEIFSFSCQIEYISTTKKHHIVFEKLKTTLVI